MLFCLELVSTWDATSVIVHDIHVMIVFISRQRTYRFLEPGHLIELERGAFAFNEATVLAWRASGLGIYSIYVPFPASVGFAINDCHGFLVT